MLTEITQCTIADLIEAGFCHSSFPYYSMICSGFRLVRNAFVKRRPSLACSGGRSAPNRAYPEQLGGQLYEILLEGLTHS